MMRGLLEWLTTWLPPPRVVYDRIGKSPYLSRYYIVGRERTLESVDPKDPPRARRARRVLWPARHHGVYLHHFHRGDDEPELHSHPWKWAISVILAGGYLEERRVGGRVRRRLCRPGSLRFIGRTTFHRVELLERDAWTLFVCGPKIARWGFWNPGTRLYLDWREFISELRAPAVRNRLRRAP
jgi:hypothetical protein